MPEQCRGSVERLSIADEHGSVTWPIAEGLVALIDRLPIAHDGNLDGTGLLPQVERPGVLAHGGCTIFDLYKFQRVVNTEVLEGVERQVGRRRAAQQAVVLVPHGLELVRDSARRDRVAFERTSEQFERRFELLNHDLVRPEPHQLIDGTDIPRANDDPCRRRHLAGNSHPTLFLDR